MEVTPLQEKILEFLAEDYKIIEIPRMLGYSYSFVEKQIAILKDIYDCQNTPALIYKHYFK